MDILFLKIIKGFHFTGKVLLMLGKVQFELQKLVDGYVSFNDIYKLVLFPALSLSLILCFVFQRSHIFQTITIPSESLLNELRIVEVCSDR